jgi:hypothetical protein
MNIKHIGVFSSFAALITLSFASAAGATSQISGFSGHVVNSSQAACFVEGAWGTGLTGWTPGAVSNVGTGSACTGVNTLPGGPYNAPFWEVALPTTASSVLPYFYVINNGKLSSNTVCYAAVLTDGALTGFSGNMSMGGGGITTPGNFFAFTSSPLSLGSGTAAMAGCYLATGDVLAAINY